MPEHPRIEDPGTCGLSIAGDSEVNGSIFGSSILDVATHVKGKWARVDPEKLPSIAQKLQLYNAANIRVDLFINNSIGYGFVDGKLVSIYQEGEINLCLNGRRGASFEAAKELLQSNGFELRSLEKKSNRSAAIFQNDQITVLVSELSSDKMGGILILSNSY